MLRVAEWPLSTLEGFACPDLWAAALAGPDLAGPDLAGPYGVALAEQRDRLCAVTTTAAFDRALTLANPVVAARWRRAGGRSPSAKARDRRLEATIMRFVCRAAGRPTPNGAWAGVAEVRHDDADGRGGIRAVPAPGGWWVEPSLVPFAQLCAWIGRSPAYLAEGAFQLDPTLHRRGGRWVVLTGRGWRVLPSHPFVDRLVTWFEAPDAERWAPLAPFVGATADGAAGQSMVWQALQGLRDLGALVPALRLDLTGGGPLVALRSVMHRLPVATQAPWRRALDDLGMACGALAAEFAGIDGEELARRAEAVRATVVALWRDLGAPGAPDATLPPIRVDRRAPWRATWDAAARARVAGALGELVELWWADGTAEQYRLRHIDALHPGPVLDELWRLTTLAPPASPAELAADEASAMPATGPATRSSVFLAHFGTIDRFEVDTRWSQLSAGAVSGEVVASPDALAGPWSSLPGPMPVAGTQVVVPDGGRLHLEWGRPQPALLAGRHHQLDVAVVISEEFAVAMGVLGLDVVDVVGRDVVDIDAAVRAALGEVLDLGDRRLVQRLALGGSGGGTERDTADATTAPVELLPVELLPVELVLGDRRLFATSCSPAASARVDPLSLLGTEVSNGNGWELLSFGLPPGGDELAVPGPLPRVLTASGHVLRRRQLVVPADRVAAIRALAPAQRYVAWAQLLSGADFGGAVTVQVGTGPPLRLPASSPLAVEALFGSLPAACPDLVIGDPPPVTLVVDDRGERYVAELAVAWWRT